jgi:hypothetical protein
VALQEPIRALDILDDAIDGPDHDQRAGCVEDEEAEQPAWDASHILRKCGR